ncbi:MAG: hypothetical protein AAFQ04_05145 [Pseudomonadota bacterium]
MRALFLLFLICTLGLTACSGFRDSRANPRNWFGGGKQEVVVDTTPGQLASPSDRQTNNPLIDDENASATVRGVVNPVDQRRRGLGVFRRRNREVVYAGTLVDQVTDVIVEPVPAGVIVRVKGLPLRQGAFDVRLLPANLDGPVNGVLEYSLNAVQPTNQPQGEARLRTVEVAQFVSNEDLEDVEQLRIVARRNASTLKQ